MSKKKQVTLIAMCWLLYVSAYLGRYSYNSNSISISNFYKITDTEFGVVSSCFFFAYGAGQIINGLLCKFYNVKYVLSGALIISSVVNIGIFLGLPFEWFKYVWLINGLSQSVLWSSLLMTLSRNLDEHYIKKAILVMSTTAGAGTFLAYGLSALLAIWDGFKLSFLVASIVMTASAVVWFLIYNKITDDKYAMASSAIETDKQTVKVKTDKSVYKILILFGFFAVIVNFIKDGLSTWVPKIILDTYNLGESFSILLTLILPVLTIFGTSFVVLLQKKFKDYAAITAILFGLSTVFTGAVVGLMITPLWGLVIIAFGFISLLMGGANNVITSIIPLSLRDKANSGFLGGILNGCCYVGSTLSSVGLGALSDYYGEWTPIFVIILIFCALATVISVAVCAIKAIAAKKRTAAKTEK